MAMAMAVKLTPGAVAAMLAGKAVDSSGTNLQYTVQLSDILPKDGKVQPPRYMAKASDGKDTVAVALPSEMSDDITAKKLENTGVIKVADFTVIPNKAIIVIKCEILASSLGKKLGAENGDDDDDVAGRVVEKKRRLSENVSEPKSASKIVLDQGRTSTTPNRGVGASRRVYPVDSLNPYQGHWTIKVHVTSKENKRTYRNARGNGSVFSVLFTDEEGTQIQATMFNEAAEKFFPILTVGKVYYVSKGTLRAANKMYSTVKNDYEMTLNSTSIVEEVEEEESKKLKCIAVIKYNFVKIEDLGPYVGGRDLVDVIGIVQSVSEVMGVRRKADNEEFSKREIVLVDQSSKTVILTLWGAMATEVGQELSDIASSAPVVAAKSIRVGGFQGVSLSTANHSSVQINPELIEAKALREWYEDGGKSVSTIGVGVGMTPNGRGGQRSQERANLTKIGMENVGLEKAEYFDVRAWVSRVKPDQNMWYNACKNCNRKLTDGSVSGSFWCEACQKTFPSMNLRYVLSVDVADSHGEARLQVFNEQAEALFGMTADALAEIKPPESAQAGSQDALTRPYTRVLEKACWKPYIMTVSVSYSDYNGMKRQRVTLRRMAQVNYAEECKHLLADIQKLRA